MIISLIYFENEIENDNDSYLLFSKNHASGCRREAK